MLPLALFILVLTVVLIGLGEARVSVGQEGVRTAENAVRRAVVSCYAVEGAYPESYEYLRDNYGLAVNEEKYTVYYEVFASNIMPEITVVARDGVK